MSVEGIAQRVLLLKGELERMRSLLAAQPTVQQVIVFGSTATGQTHEWSDLDVMVIEESEAPSIERGLRLARLVRPQVGTQFLVYTPEEIQALAHKPFVQVEMLGKPLSSPLPDDLAVYAHKSWAQCSRASGLTSGRTACGCDRS